IIYCSQNKSQFHNLKIAIMIIGYDIDFNLNNLNVNYEMHLKIKEYGPNTNELMIGRFDLNDLNEYSMFLGIPVLRELDKSNKSTVIGHYFLEDEGNDMKANIF